MECGEGNDSGHQASDVELDVEGQRLVQGAPEQEEGLPGKGDDQLADDDARQDTVQAETTAQEDGQEHVEGRFDDRRPNVVEQAVGGQVVIHDIARIADVKLENDQGERGMSQYIVRAQPDADEGIDQEPQAQAAYADNQHPGGEELPENLHDQLLVSLDDHIADPGGDAGIEGGEDGRQVGGQDQIVAIIAHDGQGGECVDENRAGFGHGISAQLMEGDVLGLLDDVRILLPEGFGDRDFFPEEGIVPVDDDADQNGADGGGNGLQAQPPDIPVFQIKNRQGLEDELDQRDQLCAKQHFVILLVCKEDILLVVEEIPKQGRVQQDSVRGVRIPEGKGRFPEDARDETEHDHASCQDDGSDDPVQASLQGDNLPDGLLVPAEKRFVKRDGHRGFYSQFSQVQEIQDAGGGRVQAHHLHAQDADEDAPGEEADQHGNHLENERGGAVSQAIAGPSVSGRWHHGHKSTFKVTPFFWLSNKRRP